MISMYTIKVTFNNLLNKRERKTENEFKYGTF